MIKVYKVVNPHFLVIDINISYIKEVINNIMLAYFINTLKNIKYFQLKLDINLFQL